MTDTELIKTRKAREAQLRALGKLGKDATAALAQRDLLMLNMHEDGVRPRDLSAAAGITVGRVHQILQRQRAAGK